MWIFEGFFGVRFSGMFDYFFLIFMEKIVIKTPPISCHRLCKMLCLYGLLDVQTLQLSFSNFIGNSSWEQSMNHMVLRPQLHQNPRLSNLSITFLWILDIVRLPIQSKSAFSFPVLEK